MTFSYNPGGGPDEFPNSREAMSARPDLTTEELIRWCEEMAAQKDSYAAELKRQERGRDAQRSARAHAVNFRAIAQRLRSERPAVTPEMIEAGLTASDKWEEAGDKRWMQTILEAALSVSSTEGKP